MYKQGKQIIIWTGNPALPTCKFVGCRDINDNGPQLNFTYEGVSTGKTSRASFLKSNMVGYAIEHVELGDVYE